MDWQDSPPSRLNGTSENVVFKQVSDLVEALGFDCGSFTIIDTSHPISSSEMLWSSYPADWSTHYQQRNFQAIDPTVNHCRASAMPVLWTPEIFSNAPALWLALCRHGLQHGWSQSTHDPRRACSILSVTRSQEPITGEEFDGKSGKMIWLCHQLHCLFVERVISNRSTGTRPLTAREVEVLQWTALGHTSADIATRLSMTARTVNFHIASTIRKLGVLNKTAAAAQATSRGLLQSDFGNGRPPSQRYNRKHPTGHVQTSATHLTVPEHDNRIASFVASGYRANDSRAPGFEQVPTRRLVKRV